MEEVAILLKMALNSARPTGNNQPNSLYTAIFQMNSPRHPCSQSQPHIQVLRQELPQLDHTDTNSCRGQNHLYYNYLGQVNFSLGLQI